MALHSLISSKISTLTPYPELWAYADNWVVGFDTAHAGDNALDWGLEKTFDETIKLSQLMNKVEDYIEVDLRSITKTIFFKVKGHKNVYYYDGIEEVLFAINGEEVVKAPMFGKVEIKILHQY